MSRQINRDPFARETLHRENVFVAKDTTCDNCGQVHKTKLGLPYLFRYFIERDSIRANKNTIKGLFCSKACMQTYHY